MGCPQSKEERVQQQPRKSTEDEHRNSRTREPTEDHNSFSVDIREHSPRETVEQTSDANVENAQAPKPNLGRRKDDPNAIQQRHSTTSSSESDSESNTNTANQGTTKEAVDDQRKLSITSGSSIGTDADVTENIVDRRDIKAGDGKGETDQDTTESNSDTDELEQDDADLGDFLEEVEPEKHDQEGPITVSLEESADFTEGREWMSVIKHVFDEAELSEDQQTQFIESLDVQEYSEGDFIVVQGELGQSLFIIESGEVTVEEDAKEPGAKPTVLSRLYPGHHFGEFSLLKEQPRVASVVARTDVKCRYITKDKFLPLLKQDARFEAVIHKLVEETENTRRKRAALLSKGTGKTRQVAFVRAEKTSTRITSNIDKSKDDEGYTCINQYRILRRLGVGAYGEVSLCQDVNTKEYFAMKVVDKAKLRKKRVNLSEEQLLQEFEVMRRLRHPNIVTMSEVINDSSGNKLYMVQELVNGGQIMDEEAAEPLSEEDARYYFRQILRGLEYMHFQRVVHRDIKPDNILVSEDKTAKLADFGVSTVIPFSEDEINGIQTGERSDYDDSLTEVQGTPAFMAPELFVENPRYKGRIADIWSLGATLYFLVTGRPPFNASNQILLAEKLLGDETPVFPSSMSPHLRNLLQLMLTKDPNQRITLPDIMRHEWVTHEGTEPLPRTNYIRIGMAPLSRKKSEQPGKPNEDTQEGGPSSGPRRGRRRRASIVMLPQQNYPSPSEDTGQTPTQSSNNLKRRHSRLSRNMSGNSKQKLGKRQGSGKNLNRGDSKRDIRRRQMELVQGHHGLSERDKDMLLEQQRMPLHNSRADVTVEEIEMVNGAYHAASENQAETEEADAGSSSSSSEISGSCGASQTESRTEDSQQHSAANTSSNQSKRSYESGKGKGDNSLNRIASTASYASLTGSAEDLNSNNASSNDLGRALYGTYSPANLSQKRSIRSVASMASYQSENLSRKNSSSAMSWDYRGRRMDDDVAGTHRNDGVLGAKKSSRFDLDERHSKFPKVASMKRSNSDLDMYCSFRSLDTEDTNEPAKLKGVENDTDFTDRSDPLKSLSSVVSVLSPTGEDTPETNQAHAKKMTSPPSVTYKGPRRRSLGMVPLAVFDDIEDKPSETEVKASGGGLGSLTGIKSMRELTSRDKSGDNRPKSLRRHQDFVMLTENVGTSERGSVKKKTVIFRARGSGSLSIATPQWGSEEKEGFSTSDSEDVDARAETKGMQRQEASGKAALRIPQVGEAIEEDSDSAEVSSLEDEGGFEDVTDKLDEVLDEAQDRFVNDPMLEALSDVELDDNSDEEQRRPRSHSSDSPALRGKTNLKAAEDARNTGLNLLFGVAEDQGKRSTMEDRMMALVEFNEAMGLDKDAPQEAFFGVYDGHNGSHCAQFLTERLHVNYASAAAAGDEPAEALINAFCETDDQYCTWQVDEASKASEDFQFSGATACTLVIRRGKIPYEDSDKEGMLMYVASAGDCRAVLSHKGVAYDLSEDHKAFREDEQERIQNSGGYVHNSRLMGILAVSRAFGDVEYKQLKEKAWDTKFEDDPLTAEPDVRAEVVSNGNEFIILACDGVWDVLTSQQAVNYVRRRLVEHQDVQAATEELVQKAISMNSADNVSAIVVAFEGNHS